MKKRVLARTKNYLVVALVGLCIILVMEQLFPNVIPFTAFEFWRIRSGGPSDWIYSSWPILAWGGGFTFLVAISTRNNSLTTYISSCAHRLKPSAQGPDFHNPPNP